MTLTVSFQPLVWAFIGQNQKRGGGKKDRKKKNRKIRGRLDGKGEIESSFIVRRCLLIIINLFICSQETVVLFNSSPKYCSYMLSLSLQELCEDFIVWKHQSGFQPVYIRRSQYNTRTKILHIVSRPAINLMTPKSLMDF